MKIFLAGTLSSIDREKDISKRFPYRLVSFLDGRTKSGTTKMKVWYRPARKK